MLNKDVFDVLIVGAGAMGLAAGYHLAGRGAKVLLIDSRNPPHTKGSHHGETRIMRHAYSLDQRYIPLLLRAQELWHELEQETGEGLFLRTGVLRVTPKDAPSVKAQLRLAQANGIAAERLRPEEIHYRWPGLRVSAAEIGCYEPDGGVLLSDAGIRGYRKLALRKGAVLRTYEPVERLFLRPDSVTVHTGQAAYHAQKLIVSAGAWTPRLLGPLKLPLTPVRKALAWFEPNGAAYHALHLPAFVHQVALGEYYGVPDIQGGGLKLGRHDGGQSGDPQEFDRRFGAFPEDEGDLRRFLERYAPGANGRIVRTAVAAYASAAGGHFLIDRHPEHAHVQIASGFSGHGFKFASVLGEALADIALTGRSRHDLSLFTLEAHRAASAQREAT